MLEARHVVNPHERAAVLNWEGFNTAVALMRSRRELSARDASPPLRWCTLPPWLMWSSWCRPSASLTSWQYPARHPCWGGKSPWSIVVSLVAPRTSAVVVASTRVDSGRFSALDKDLSDTEVDEGGGEAPRLSANVRESTVNESSNFEVIATSDAEGPTFGRRRLVVSQQEVAPTVMDVPPVVSGESHEPSEVESDVESIRCSTRTTLLTNVDMPIVDLMIGAAARAALQDLDDVDLEAEFCTRACVMKSPPAFLRCHHRSAMRFALSEADRAHDPVGASRAWKLFLLLPRLLLHRPARGNNIPKCRLKDRFSARGWPLGWFAPSESREFRPVGSFVSQTAGDDDIQRRADRAKALIQFGELSSWDKCNP